MKAAPLTQKPQFKLMKLNDIQSFCHLQMPRWLFFDAKYFCLSLEAKVVYTFLLNRFQLSRLNNWANDDGEVFIIYTRASLAEEMRISYRKVIESMKELSVANLIWERRCGRGDANQIYLAQVELSENGTSKPSQTAYQEMPKQHVNNIDLKEIDKNTNSSQSVALQENGKQRKISDRQADGGVWELERILTRCGLENFAPEVSGVFAGAIERLYFTERYRIGGAVLPKEKVRSHLRCLDYQRLREAERKIAANTSQNIRNATAYTMAVIFNSIWEFESDLLLDPYLNSLKSRAPTTVDSGRW